MKEERKVIINAGNSHKPYRRAGVTNIHGTKFTSKIKVGKIGLEAIVKCNK